MTIRVIYEGGVLRLLEPLNLPEKSEWQVEVSPPESLSTERIRMPGRVTLRDLQHLRGSLKPRDIDPVEWQRKMRDEEWL